MPKTDPIRETDDAARTLARDLIDAARHGALATLRDGRPFVTRVALAPDGADLLTLVSDLSPHTQAMRAAPDVSLLIGEPGKGDPLAHPRITLFGHAVFTDKTRLRDVYLAHQPKAQLYYDFADFHLVRIAVAGAELNGGFGKAYRLTRADIA